MEKLDRIVDKTKETKETHMIYYLKPEYGENVACIQPKTMMEENKITDDLLDRYKIAENIWGEIYRCNIIDNFLLSSKKLPCICISVSFEKNMLRSYIYKLFLQFTITESVKNANQLIRNRLQGKYTIELVGDKHIKLLDVIDMEKDGSIKKLIQKMKKLTELPEMIEMTNNTIQERIREKYGDFIDYNEIYGRIKKSKNE
jgi:hypothetical protein